MKPSMKTDYLIYFEGLLRITQQKITTAATNIEVSTKSIKEAERKIYDLRGQKEEQERIKRTIKGLISAETSHIYLEQEDSAIYEGAMEIGDHTEEQAEEKAETHFKSLQQIQDEDEH